MGKTISEVNGISITKNLIGINYTKGIFIKPKYIIVHDIRDERFATMREYRNYIARDTNAKVSVHYLVGARAVIKILEDDWRGWHVGDRPSKEVTNSNSIAVAMFIKDSKDDARTVQNTIELVNKLREKYNISIKNVKRHYDVTGRECPKVLMNEEVWQKFKVGLKGITHELKPKNRGKIIGVLSSLNMKKEPKDEAEVIGKIKSDEIFYIYGQTGNWVKTVYETEERIYEGYLSKDYIEILPLEEKTITIDEELIKNKINDKEVEEEQKALDEIRKMYKTQEKVYDPFLELAKLNNIEEGRIITEVKVENKIEEKKEIIETPVIKMPVIRKDMEREGIIVNVDGNLEVRRGPGKENFVIGYLLASQQIKITQEIGEWYKIIYQSTIGRRIGYVEKNFVKLI